MSAHEHRFIPVTAKVIGRADNRDGETQTIVLQRCKCGAVDHERIPGVWTLKEISGRNRRPVSDREFLAAVGIAIPRKARQRR